MIGNPNDAGVGNPNDGQIGGPDTRVRVGTARGASPSLNPGDAVGIIVINSRIRPPPDTFRRRFCRRRLRRVYGRSAHVNAPSCSRSGSERSPSYDFEA
jgi:hypothetical protein